MIDLDREEFKRTLIAAGWGGQEAEIEAASVYDDPMPGDAQDVDGDLML
jgi:hypothetical protein